MKANASCSVNVAFGSSSYRHVYFPSSGSRDFGELSLAVSTTVAVKGNSLNTFQSFFGICTIIRLNVTLMTVMASKESTTCIFAF